MNERKKDERESALHRNGAEAIGKEQQKRKNETHTAYRGKERKILHSRFHHTIQPTNQKKKIHTAKQEENGREREKEREKETDGKM